MSTQAGKVIFSDKCVRCHGEGGKGDGPDTMTCGTLPADFTDAHMMSGMTDGEIFWKITKGRKPMPSFEEQLSDEQRWQLVNFLCTFTNQPAPAPALAPAPAAKKPASAARKPVTLQR